MLFATTWGILINVKYYKPMTLISNSKIYVVCVIVFITDKN